jgi:hypothetical protein
MAANSNVKRWCRPGLKQTDQPVANLMLTRMPTSTRLPRPLPRPLRWRVSPPARATPSSCSEIAVRLAQKM